MKPTSPTPKKLWNQIKLFVLISIPLLWSCVGFAQEQPSGDSTDYYVVQNNYPVQSLSEKTKVWIDETGEATIEDILSGKPEIVFINLMDTLKYIDLGGANSDPLLVFTGKRAVWTKLSLKSEIDISKWWLICWDGNNTFDRYITKNNYVNAYYVNNNLISHQTKAGYLDPASQKDIADKVTVSRIYATVQEGEKVDIYCRFEDERIFPIMELRDSSFPLPDVMADYGRSIQVMSSFYFIIGIYVLFFYFFTRDISYLYFTAMAACLYLHYQILHPYSVLIDWFFPENPEWVYLAWSILTSSTYIFLFMFGRKFTDMRSLSPFWDKVMLWMIRVLTSFLAFRTLLFLTGYPLPNSVGYLIALLVFTSILVLVSRLVFIKNALVRYFVAGAGWLTFFALWGILWEMGFLPFFSNPNPWVISQTGFIFIFALGLAHKIQLSERARGEVIRVKEIDAVKSRFFANISHEFRTPLTLILAPLKKLINGTAKNPQDYFQTMEHNASRLLQLVNQLLDLSKLDSGKMKLKLQEGDVNAYLKAIIYSFESMAESKQLHFQTRFPQEAILIPFDKDKIEKIVSNLLSNAFKFSPEKGTVNVEVETSDKYLRINVEDSGNGIPKNQLNKIFDRFYQVEKSGDSGSVGSGIGLSLVKELVELHKGQISVSSEEGKGTRFKISLPLNRKVYAETDFKYPSENENSGIEKSAFVPFAGSMENFIVETEIEKQDATLPLLLLVEDNKDLRNFISGILKEHYRVIEAIDGQDGLEKASDEIPDLIISDVMMPRMDGNELCAALKTNERTSHIPVILLTAKAGIESKLEGLETGADDYLTKPFNEPELLLRIQNLIEQRRRLRARFSKEIKLKPKEVAVTSADEVFLNKVLIAIEDNIGDETFSVEVLGRVVGMSRSQLHRKLTALCNQTPNAVIRRMRLQRGKDLLENGAGNVSEIAYEVGFSSPSYFAKCFHDEFGKSPSAVK